MRSWSINAKFLGILSVFTAGAIAIAAVGLLLLRKIEDNLENVVTSLYPRVALAHDVRDLQRKISLREMEIILEPDAAAVAKLVAAKNDLYENQKQKIAAFALVAAPDGKQLMDEYVAQHDLYWAVTHEVQALAAAGRTSEAAALVRDKGRPFRLKALDSLDAIEDSNAKRMSEAHRQAQVDYANAQKLIMVISAVALLLGAALAWAVLRILNRSIDRVIGQLQDGAGSVSCAAAQISSAAQELSSATTEQAASLQETSSSVDEMSAMTQRNSELAVRVADSAGASKDQAERGQRVVRDMIGAIEAINHSNAEIMAQIEQGNQEIAGIVKVIAEIGSKTKVINDIVFQTKLLSFNASVEAARAGEHGKGFAVVAEEVGKLAQMSGNAAKEISTLLDGSIERVESIIASTKTRVERLVATGKEKVEVGTQIAGDCGRTLEEIVRSVASVTAMADEIARASKEQAQGIAEVTKAMSELDGVTQQNAATSEQSASASEDLSGQAQGLRNVVHELIVTVKGTGLVSERSAVEEKPSQAQEPERAAAGAVVRLIPKAGAKKAAGSGGPVAVKKAVGESVPSQSDPRFEDV